MRLTIFTLSGVLLFISFARAEIVYMNCKFNEGWHQKGIKYEPVNKGRLASTQEWKIEKLGRKYY